MTRPRPHSQNSNSGVLILNSDPRHHLAKYGPSPTMVTSFVLFIFWSYSWLQGDSSDLSSEQPLKHVVFLMQTMSGVEKTPSTPFEISLLIQGMTID